MPEFTDARALLTHIDEQYKEPDRERRKVLTQQAVLAACPLLVNATCADHKGPSDRERLATQYLTLAFEGEQARRRAEKATQVLAGVALALLLATTAGLVIAVAQIFGRRVVFVGGLSLTAGVVIAALLAMLLEKTGPKRDYLATMLVTYPVFTVVFFWLLLQDPIMARGGSYPPTPLGALAVVGVTVGAFLAAVIIFATIMTVVDPLLEAVVMRGRRRDAAFHAAAVAFMAMADRGDGHKGMPALGTLTRLAHHLWRMDSERRLADRDLRAVVADRFHQASTAVRATALWVALPNADTHAELQRFLVRLMRTLLDENYDDLPLTPPITPIVRKRALLSFLRTVIVGLLPAALLLTFHLLGLDANLEALVGKNIADKAPILAGGWAAVTLLLLLDPNLRERLEALKNFKNWLGPKSGE